MVGGSAPPPGASTFARADQTDRHIHLSRSGADAPPKHVLVCAPSNAAIDEIVSRLLQRCGGVGGLLDGDGARCARAALATLAKARSAVMALRVSDLAGGVAEMFAAGGR